MRRALRTYCSIVPMTAQLSFVSSMKSVLCGAQKEQIGPEVWSALSGITYFEVASADDVAAVDAAVLWLASKSLAIRNSIDMVAST